MRYLILCIGIACVVSIAAGFLGAWVGAPGWSIFFVGGLVGALAVWLGMYLDRWRRPPPSYQWDDREDYW